MAGGRLPTTTSSNPVWNSLYREGVALNKWSYSALGCFLGSNTAAGLCLIVKVGIAWRLEHPGHGDCCSSYVLHYLLNCPLVSA